MIKKDQSNYKYYTKKAEEIENTKKDKLLKNLQINFFTNFTAELLDSFFRVEFEAKGYRVKNYYYSYGSIEENILGKYNFINEKNQIFFFHFRTEDLFTDLGSEILANNKKKLLEIVNQKINHLQNLFIAIRKNTNCNIFVSNFSSIPLNLIQTLENSLSFNQYDLIYYLNSELRNLVKKFSSIFIYDYYSFSSSIGSSNLYDNKMWFMARFPFKSKYNAILVKSYIRSIVSTLETPKKCLVCDLDNTLWGGIIGETEDAVQLGEQFPGNIYKSFQQLILNLKRTGVFLAIASKNNEKDVCKFIDGNEDCLIKTKDFAIIKSNWEDKAKNILEISKELNIGLDAIVFFDDNPVEREWVKSKLPEVNVIDVPENPIFFEDSLVNSNFFDKTTITEDDKKRPLLFSNEKSRKKHKKLFSDYDEFLKSLNMKIFIRKATLKDVPRVSQLINKVNQFNLTLKRSNEGQVLSYISSKNCIYSIKLEDKFGDYGTVGVILLNFLNNGIWEIDNFLLSCRALGRKVENISLYYLLNFLKKDNNEKILGSFVVGEKNMQAKNFYKDMGFTLNKTNGKWLWEFKKNKTKKIDYAEVIYFE